MASVPVTHSGECQIIGELFDENDVEVEFDDASDDWGDDKISASI